MSADDIAHLKKEVGDLQATVSDLEAKLYESEKDREDLVDRIYGLEQAQEDRQLLFDALGLTYQTFLKHRKKLETAPREALVTILEAAVRA